jgi:hypothetical protein
VCGDEKHVSVGALKIAVIRVVFGSEGEDLIEEKRVLEATLD